MSLKEAARVRTVCEVLREINDLHQEQTTHDKAVRKLLCEAEDMGKRMSRKLIYQKLLIK